MTTTWTKLGLHASTMRAGNNALTCSSSASTPSLLLRLPVDACQATPCLSISFKLPALYSEPLGTNVAIRCALYPVVPNEIRVLDVLIGFTCVGFRSAVCSVLKKQLRELRKTWSAFLYGIKHLVVVRCDHTLSLSLLDHLQEPPRHHGKSKV